jgi:hypothetical protein
LARNYYNKFGFKTGYSRSSREEGRETAGMLLIAVVLAPFYPLFVVASQVYGFLTTSLNLHSLFAGIGSIAIFGGGLYLLWKSVTFRYVYLGGSTAFATYYVFQSTYPARDVVWASFLALLTLAFGSAITYAAGLFGRPVEEEEPTRTSPHFGEPEFTEPYVPVDGEGAALSYPLSTDQAVELLDGIDDTTFDVLHAIIQHSPEPHLAGLSWAEVQSIAGGQTWSQFARGTMARLHRKLRKITGDPEAVLLLDSDKLNLTDEPTLNQAKVLLIHGPAVQTLRSVFQP